MLPPAFIAFLRRLLLSARAALAQGIAVPTGWLARLLRLPVAPRPGAKSISTAWLTRTLRGKGVIGPGIRVATAKIEPINDNRGLVSAMSRVRVTYSPEDPSAPTSFVLKMSFPGFAKRYVVLAGGQDREALFYGSPLAAKLPVDLAPACYYANASSLLGEFVILLQDAGSFTPVNFVYGNQVWGVPRPLDPPRDAVDVARSVFCRAAELHELFWQDPLLLKTVRGSLCVC